MKNVTWLGKGVHFVANGEDTQASLFHIITMIYLELKSPHDTALPRCHLSDK